MQQISGNSKEGNRNGQKKFHTFGYKWLQTHLQDSHSATPQVLHPSLVSTFRQRHQSIGKSPEAATNQVPQLRKCSYPARLKTIGITSLKDRKLRGDMSEVYKLLTRTLQEQRHCGAWRRKWRLTDTDLCPCGETQMMYHIDESCHLSKVVKR